MSQRELTQVLLTGLGIYCVIRGFGEAARTMGIWWPYTISLFTSKSSLPHLLPAGTTLVLAAMLLRYARVLAQKLFGDDAAQGAPESLSVHDCYIVAFSVIGVLILIWEVLPGVAPPS